MKPWLPFLILSLVAVPALAGDATIFKPDLLQSDRKTKLL
jgi:hypothetical protein